MCAVALMLAMLVSGCSHLSAPHLSWPWHRQAPLPPAPVNELTITSDGSTAATFPQYWQRNTLLVDLQGASGTGSVVLKPVEGTTWPVRLALRVTPGQIGIVEVRADQRQVLPITAQGPKPVDLELSPGVYTLRTAQITVSWRPATADSPPSTTPSTASP
jgi:hypothetical protein